MNYFESELRKLFEDRYPDATFVGRHCYVPLSDETRANICFKTSGYADHYDTLSVKVVDRKQGTIDVVDIKLLELTKSILETCIDLLGFEAPEKM